MSRKNNDALFSAHAILAALKSSIRVLRWGMAGLVLVYLGSGGTKIGPNESGLVLRFGKNALPDTTKAGWRDSLRALFDGVTDLLLTLGGVPAGEHGAGRLRAGVLDRFYGDDVMELFRTVKRGYDPLSIFNPGVIIPANDWSPVTALKVGDDAAAIPDDIATRLRDVERTAAWATPKLQLAR